MGGFDDETKVVLVVVFVLDHTRNVFLRCPIPRRQLLRRAEEHEVCVSVVGGDGHNFPGAVQNGALIGLEGAADDLLFDPAKRGYARFRDGLRELRVALAEVVPRSIPRQFAGTPGRRGAGGGGEGTSFGEDAEERFLAFVGHG